MWHKDAPHMKLWSRILFEQLRAVAIGHHQVKCPILWALEPENCTHVSQHLEQMGIALVIMPTISIVRCYRHCLDSGKLSLSKNYLGVTEPGVLAWKKSLWKKQKMRKRNRIRHLMYIISQGKEGVWETVIIFKHSAPFTVFFITHNHHVYPQARSAFVQV